MMKYLFNYNSKNLIKILLSAIMLLFFTLSMSAQSFPDFSGIWIQDVNRSDDFYKDFNIKCTIIQTRQLFTVKTTFSDKGGTELVTRESTFSLDGNETTNEEGAKLFAKWLPDNKTLVTSDTKDYGGDIVGVTASYSVSEDGMILTVKTSDIKPDVKAITQVFAKSKN